VDTFNSASMSSAYPDRVHRLVLGPGVTIRSRSLSSSASPRATEPKTRDVADAVLDLQCAGGCTLVAVPSVVPAPTGRRGHFDPGDDPGDDLCDGWTDLLSLLG
jgi:hypothetical protein